MWKTAGRKAVILRRFGRDHRRFHRRQFHRVANHTNPPANETDLRTNDGDVRRQHPQRLQGDDGNPSASHDGLFSLHQQTEISNNEYRSWEVEKVDKLTIVTNEHSLHFYSVHIYPVTIHYRDQQLETHFYATCF